MKPTEQMIVAFGEAWHATPEGEPGDRRRAGLQAVLDLLDPVPHGMLEIRDSEGRLWRRTAPGWMTWHRPNVSWSVMDLHRLCGPLTTRDGEPL